MGGSHKGLKGVILCLLVLGLVLLDQQVQVEARKSCCKNRKVRYCYDVCRLKGDMQACANLCDCIIIGGTSCPADYPRLHTHSVDSDTPNAVEFCNMGCMSSVCDNANSVYRGEEEKIDVELCGSACASFCNKIDVGASVAA